MQMNLASRMCSSFSICQKTELHREADLNWLVKSSQEMALKLGRVHVRSLVHLHGFKDIICLPLYGNILFHINSN